MTEEQYKAMSKDVRQQVRSAVEWAEASPVPDLSELYTDVLAS